MKKLLLLTVLLAYSTTVLSQLFVRPNGGTSGTDSYVYVKDEILFVEQDVNLEDNGAGTTRASIYLRNEGQLIQGTSNSNNSGNGVLSVQQINPDSDAWDYTYWCSPVGGLFPSGNVAAGNKTFGIQHLYEASSLTDATATNYTANFNGFNDPELTISSRWIYTHTLPGTEAEGAYQYRGQNKTIPAGFGFTMKGVNNSVITGNNDTSGAGNHDQNYDFRGRPNNGIFTYDVDDGLMTLAGNPYPSAIDMYDVVTDNPDVGTIWYYDEERDIDSHYYTQKRYSYVSWIPGGGSAIPASLGGGTTGTYASPTFVEWDASGGTGGGGTGGTAGDYERRFAPIGQGFMLVGNNSTPGWETAEINNSMRVFRKESEGYSDFRRPGDGSITVIDPGDPDPDPIEERWPELRIVTEFRGSNQREMVLLFHDDATDDYDHGMDGMHPMDATSEIYFPIKHNEIENPYVIQTVPFDIDKVIPVTIKLNLYTKVDINIVEEINFNENAYILDIENETFQQITNDNTAGFVLNPGLYEDRFYIVFKNRNDWWRDSEGTIVKEETRENVDFFQNNPLKQLEIRNPEGYDIKSAMVYDMAGKLVISKSNLGSNSNITLSTSNITDGIYLVQLVTSENINIDYKMIIKNN